MGRSGVALDSGDVMGELVDVFGGVGFGAGASGFFVHPGDDAEGAGGAQVQALENFCCFHGDHHAGSVVSTDARTDTGDATAVVAAAGARTQAQVGLMLVQVGVPLYGVWRTLEGG